MRTIIIAIVFYLPTYLNAQGFLGIGISTNYITEKDDVIILDTVDLSSNDFRINQRVNYTNDTLYLYLCYRRGAGAQGGKSLNEETNIGKLTSGKYHLKLIGTMTFDTACFSGSSFFSELTIDFEVHAFPNNLKEIKGDIAFGLYPNPTGSSTMLEIYASSHQQINITLADVTGKLILNKTEEVNGVKNIPIDISNLTSGMYVLNIKSENISKTFKIMKQ